MNKLEEIIIYVIFIIVNVVVICTPLYFVQKFLYNEIHQKFTEVRDKCECMDKNIDEDRKENNQEFMEIWKNLTKLKIILRETQAKLTANQDKLANPSNQTEAKNPESKSE
ncbi:MAG: hypothetical protein Q8807_03120 ['Waltheria sp.' little leaf phytoplasma]|nr:hypothetical protein ['Waltheria sp.' little leaf phytoplasma]